MPNGNNSENIENYNEKVQEYYAKLNELEREGEWDKIVDMVCAPITIDPNMADDRRALILDFRAFFPDAEER